MARPHHLHWLLQQHVPASWLVCCHMMGTGCLKLKLLLLLLDHCLKTLPLYAAA